MAKAAYWTVTDVEARKRGEQTGLDTLVVHAVNDRTLPGLDIVLTEYVMYFLFGAE